MRLLKTNFARHRYLKQSLDFFFAKSEISLHQTQAQQIQVELS
jgi:hypothetical protein